MFFERADIFLLVMCLICSLFGIYMVRIATIAMEASGWVDSSVKCVIVQVFSLFLGLGAFVLLTFIDADLLAEQWKLLCAINIALLIALVLFGSDSGTGNNSWIRFAGIGIQPSEIIKVIYIVVSAKQMTWLKEYHDINSFMSVVQMAGHFVILFGLIIVVSSDGKRLDPAADLPVDVLRAGRPAVLVCSGRCRCGCGYPTALDLLSERLSEEAPDCPV